MSVQNSLESLPRSPLREIQPVVEEKTHIDQPEEADSIPKPNLPPHVRSGDVMITVSPTSPPIVGEWIEPIIVRGKGPRFYDRTNGTHVGVIYVFWNTHTNECYTGKTETAFRKRLYSHNSCIKTSQGDFYKAVRANPGHFRLGVLELLDLDAQDSSDRETHHIANLKRLGFRVYNCNGGGGGYAIREERVFDPRYESPVKLHSLSPERVKMKSTPQKLYPFLSPGGTKKFQPTPIGKKKERVLYAIVDKGTDELPRRKYYGRTARTLIERAGEHGSLTRSVTPEDEEEKELYREMGSRPEDFSLGIVYEQHELDPPLRDLEAYAQRKARERGEELYNSKSGGGGGTVHSSKRRKKTSSPSTDNS